MMSKKLFSIITTLVILSVISMSVFFIFKVAVELKENKESDKVFNDLLRSVEHGYEPVDHANLRPITNAIKIDWEQFKGTDIVAWLQLDDIQYPIMQGRDNKYYLNHLPDGSYNSSGSVFLLSENNKMLEDSSSFIYGHNMGSGRMFGALKRYTDASYRAKEFYIYLPDGTRKVYEFFSVTPTIDNSRVYTWSFGSEQSFLDWQHYMKKKSMYDTNGEVSSNNKFVTLSTCDGYAGTSKRLVVCGRESRTEQIQKPASWYNNQ